MSTVTYRYILINDLVPRIKTDQALSVQLDDWSLTAFPELQIVVRSFAQRPPVDAEIEFRISGLAIESLQDLGEELRLSLAEHPDVLHTQAIMSRSEPILWLDADENEGRLAVMPLNDVATQLQGSLAGIVGGSIVEDLEEMAVRIRYSDNRRSQLAAIRSSPAARNGNHEAIAAEVLGCMQHVVSTTLTTIGGFLNF